MSYTDLPPDLPEPVDDGAADHLGGMHLPAIELVATTGERVALPEVGSPWAVIYLYPKTGRPDTEMPTGWEMIPGARGCTPQTCAFRDHAADLAELGAEVYGLSVQTTEYQREMVERLHVPFPVLSDPGMDLGAALNLPTMSVEGSVLYKRLTLIVRGGRIEHAMYPVFPPDRNAGDVIAWLRRRMEPKSDARGAWNERYEAAAELYGAQPNQFVAAELADLDPRRVLDLGCGQGRNAVWLASRGHQVTGIDLSDVGIDQARRLAARSGVDVDFRREDVVANWEPTEQYDLVVLSYMQLPDEARRNLHSKAVAALAPGGELFLIAHHADNLDHGVGGPPTADVLFDEKELESDFGSLDIARNEKVFRDVESEGQTRRAHDILFIAHKPAA